MEFQPLTGNIQDGAPAVSALMRNRSGAFSVERLMDFLTALGQDVEITVRPTRKPHGEVYVSG